jgi:molecular chaperone GrpE
MSKKNKKHMKKEEKVEEAINETEQTEETKQTELSKPTEQSEQSEETERETEVGEAATEEEKLLAALSEAETKYNDLHDKYLRQMAEFENYRKRTLKEKSELILNGSAHLMTAVLPILDDMDRALDAMSKTDETDSIREGFTLIANKFRATLEQNGLRKIETEGKTFDTDFHDAVALMPATDELPKGTVIDCVQTGYTLNDKVLRHSKVVVAD